MSAPPILRVDDLHVHYQGLGWTNRAVNGVSLEMPARSIMGLVGGSGSGKSTTALAIMGLTRGRGRIVSGQVALDGRELLGLSVDEWEAVRGAQIGLVTQNPRAALNPIMRVGDQIASVYRRHQGGSKPAARSRAADLLRLVGINDPARRLDAFPDELSGGMAQRVLIAMALSCEPRLLIADEPTSGLDVTVQAQILEDLANSVATVGSGLLLVTQDLAVVANYCDQVSFMSAGEIAEHAETERFYAAPHHPGSLALLAVQQRAGDTRFRMTGPVFDGRALPKGCYIHPRCPFALYEDGCMTVHPELVSLDRTHSARCHRATQVAEAWSASASDGNAHVG